MSIDTITNARDLDAGSKLKNLCILIECVNNLIYMEKVHKFKFSKSYQLILPQISLSDILATDDLLEQKLYENLEAKPSEIIYDKIPPLFTSLSEWPTSTNLHCWQCTRSFSGRPWFIPISLKQNVENPEQIEMKTDGNYCSANCGVTIINKMDKQVREKIHRNMFIIVELFTGKKVDTIIPAPEKNKMKKYGGEWSEEEFNSFMTSIEIEVKVKPTKHDIVTVYDFYRA